MLAVPRPAITHEPDLRQCLCLLSCVRLIHSLCFVLHTVASGNSDYMPHCNHGTRFERQLRLYLLLVCDPI
jgi:hypothetical protein